MADFVLKVTPAQLETRAKAVESHIKAFENDWKQMVRLVVLKNLYAVSNPIWSVWMVQGVYKPVFVFW